MRESPGFAGGRRRGYKSELKRRSLTAIYKAVVPSPPSGCAPINGIPRRRWRPFVRINSTKGSTLSRSYSLLVALREIDSSSKRSSVYTRCNCIARGGPSLRSRKWWWNAERLSLDFFGGEKICFLFFLFGIYKRYLICKKVMEEREGSTYKSCNKQWGNLSNGIKNWKNKNSKFDSSNKLIIPP